MKIKLDENLGSLRVATRLRLAGHDIATVREQDLNSINRGFGNRMRFFPQSMQEFL